MFALNRKINKSRICILLIGSLLLTSCDGVNMLIAYFPEYIAEKFNPPIRDHYSVDVYSLVDLDYNSVNQYEYERYKKRISTTARSCCFNDFYVLKLNWTTKDGLNHRKEIDMKPLMEKLHSLHNIK